MKKLSAAQITGVWATVLLPLDPDDRIRMPALIDQIDTAIISGVDGLYAHGTSGEFHTLNEDEYDSINVVLAERAEAARVPFQIGASHPATPVMLQRIRQAAQVNPGAIQVILPDWVTLSDDEILRFMAGAAGTAQGIPLVLYNPPHAKTRVGPTILMRLIEEVPSLVGLKTGGGDDGWYQAMEPIFPRLSVFIPGHTLATGIQRGAHGSYSNVAALSPSGAIAWARTTNDDPLLGLEIEQRIHEFFAHHVAPLQRAGLSNPALDKFLAAVGDWADIGLRTRWPTTAAPSSAVAAAVVDSRRLLPELFEA